MDECTGDAQCGSMSTEEKRRVRSALSESSLFSRRGQLGTRGRGECRFSPRVVTTFGGSDRDVVTHEESRHGEERGGWRDTNRR